MSTELYDIHPQAGRCNNVEPSEETCRYCEDPCEEREKILEEEE